MIDQNKQRSQGGMIDQNKQPKKARYILSTLSRRDTTAFASSKATATEITTQ
jgi:hypothetical protein